MSKKLLVILGVVILLIITATVFFFANSIKKDTTPSSPGALTNRTPTSIPIQDLVYTDESGFSFKYFSDLKVNDVTPGDATYYTLLEVVKAEEKLTVSIRDTKSKTVDDWLKKDAEAPKDSQLVGGVSLGGLSTKQYSYTLNGSDMLLTVAIDQGVLYKIDGLKDGGYWEDVHSMLISTFAFAGQTAPGTSSTGGSGIIDEGEEVVQ